MSARRWVILVALAVLGAGAGALVAGGSGPGGARRPVAGPDRRLGPIAARAPVGFSVLLRLPRQRAFDRFGRAVQDPRSPAYRHFIDAATIGRRYGLPLKRLAALRRQLHRAGLTVVSAYPQRLSMQVQGPAAAVQRLLGTRLAEYRDAQGRRYHRALLPPRVPGPLRDAVTGVSGLDDKPLDLTAAVPAGGLTPAAAALAYDVTPLHQLGLEGQGQTVAVFSNDSFKPSDISTFDRLAGISGAPPVRAINVRGPFPFAGGSAAAEVDLDIEVIRGLAPRAQILNYQIPETGPDMFSVAVQRIVSDGRADLINMSYGACELDSSFFGSPATLLQLDRAFAAAAMRGVTVFVSSGDQGAFPCDRFNASDHRVAAAYPASSPNVVSVGGTYLDLNADGSYLGELGWENPLTRSGGGGGNSVAFARPAWQSGAPGLVNPYNSNPPARQVPDVAATADSDTGFAIVTRGSTTQAGGTSAAAPFWTGSMVLIRQLAQQQGFRGLGFVAPMLYRIATRTQPFPAFHDVTLGGNLHYPATAGWDYSTGLGTPDVYNLARDMINALKHP